MSIGQNQKGATVNASVSVDPFTGQFVYSFFDPYNMLVNLTNSTGISILGGGADDQFNLENATGDTINAGNGNVTFSISRTALSLNGNVIKGGTGLNLVQFNGSGTDVNLDQGFGSGTAASNIEMVVGRTGLTGNSVEVNLNQLSTSSLTYSGAPGTAFVAVLGRDGMVNVAAPNGYQLVGEVDANSTVFDPSGNVLTGGAASGVSSQVTSVANVEGDLAVDYAGAYNKGYNPAVDDAYVLGNLSAYVFTNGTTSYTVWADGTVNVLPTSGAATTTAYQPAAVAITSTPTLGTFDQFHQYDPDTSYKYATGTLGVNPAGLTKLYLYPGNTLAYGAVLLNGVTGTVVHGTGGLSQGHGPNGGNWFGLGPSGGNNTVMGSPVGDIFDLQNSTSLIDTLRGSTGFDVVRARNPNSAPDDVDLTAGNATTGLASRNIDAVVGTLSQPDTVEVDLSTLKVTTVGTTREALFEALLGGPSSTLTLSAPTGSLWNEVASWAPGTAAPTNAESLSDPKVLSNLAILDALYNGGKTTAENSLTGYLFEQESSKGAALKYVTVYTDASMVDNLAPVPAALTQAMASMSSSSASTAGLAGAGLSSTISAHTLAKPIA